MINLWNYDQVNYRTAYDMAKVSRRNPVTGKQYTDRDFARDYLDSNFSMVSKILSGKAVSKPVIDAIRKFVKDSELLIDMAMKDVKSVIDDKV